MRRYVIALLFLAGIPGSALAQSLALSAPPKLDVEASHSLYAPLAALLSSETGETIEYIHPGSWFEYQIDMRKGRFDLMLDDAHFAAWRIKNLDHEPLVRAREQVRFVVIAARDGRVYSKEDLIGEPVCAASPPDLGTLGLLQVFEGFFQVPRVLETRDTLERIERLLAGDCTGAFLARHEYMHTEAINRVSQQLKIVTQSQPYPGLTLTAGGDITPTLANEIKRIFLSRKGGQVTKRIRGELANGSNFVEAAASDYEGLAGLVEGYPAFDGDAE